MPRPLPPDGPRRKLTIKFLQGEIDAIEAVTKEQDLASMSDAVRFLCSEADNRFAAPERGRDS